MLYFDNTAIVQSTEMLQSANTNIITFGRPRGVAHWAVYVFFLKSELKMKVHMISLSTDNCSANLTYRSAVQVFSFEEFLSRLVCEM